MSTSVPNATDPHLSLAAVVCENDLLRLALDDLRAEREREAQDRTSAQEALASAKWVLEAQNETLKDVDRAKDAFVANLAHELRTPLTSITGYIELMTEGVLSEEQRQFAETIARNSAHLLNLIEDLLSTAAIHSGKLELATDALDIRTVVSECVADARPRAAAKQIDLRLEPAESMCASADRTRIRQVVVNLISNAIKFTPPGGTVTVRLTREADRIVLDVADNGPGITAADQARVFERFYRTSGATDTPGTGLGLAIVKAIVEAHGGRVLLESRLGDGTTFRVELPLAGSAMLVAA